MLIIGISAQTLLDLPKNIFELYDDEILCGRSYKFFKITKLVKVNNPVNDKECLSDPN